jgi:putative NIF3 family GTP cyclohydrolase 1 type 2
MNRRKFLVASAAATGLSAAGPLTAGAVVDRIRKQVGVPWREQTVDTFKAGGPETPVTGIATTFMATFDVVQRAAAAGRNFVITHEPTFYNHEDQTREFATDPVYAAKAAFIEKNRMAIFRFHDHWHARRPDGIMAGVVATLGWDKYRSAEGHGFTLPPTTLEALAADLRGKLRIKTIRVIGDPRLPVKNVAYGPGFNSLQGGMRTLARPETDVLVIGESREWETIEYAQDAIAAGQKKGLIILGHAISEEPGMRECAAWLKTFISEVPIEFVPAGEPFWAPKA